MINPPDMSSIEEVSIINEGREHEKWNTSQKKLLALMSVLVMLNSSLYMHMAANAEVYMSAGQLRTRPGACAVRGLTCILTNLVAATIMDYVGCYKILLLGSLLVPVAPIAIAFFDKSYLAGIAALGIVTGLIDTTASVTIASTFRHRIERYEAFAVMWAARYFGNLVLAPLAAIWHFFFNNIFMAAYFFIYLIIFLMLAVCHKSVVKHLTNVSKLSNPSVPMSSVVANGKVLAKMALLILSMDVFTLAYFTHGRPLWASGRSGGFKWTWIVVWLPYYVPYVLGAILIVTLSKKYHHCMGQTLLLSLAAGGVCCYVKYFIRNSWYSIIPISCIPVCTAIIDVAVSVSFAQHMEDHHGVSSYAAIYGLANIVYSLCSITTNLTDCTVLEMMVIVCFILGKFIENFLKFLVKRH